MDTLLGVASHGSLAVGLVAVAVASPRSIDVEAYLFGEILAVTRGDLAVIWGGAALVPGRRGRCRASPPTDPDVPALERPVPHTTVSLKSSRSTA